MAPSGGTSQSSPRMRLFYAAVCAAMAMAFVGLMWLDSRLQPPIDPDPPGRLPPAKFARPDQFIQWLQQERQGLKWTSHPGFQKELSSAVLRSSLQLGREFLIKNQAQAGNFNYSYNFLTRELDRADNSVRQAGALWGLSLAHQHQPGDDARKALERGLDFFIGHSRPTFSGEALAVAYPGEADSKSGTVALTALAIIDFLRAAQTGPVPLSEEGRRKFENTLDGYLRHIERLRLGDGHFSESWSLEKKARSLGANPYSDGECLLCLIKAAKYLGYSRLVPAIEEAAWSLANSYTAAQWSSNRDSDLTKGFFQWSCMALCEYRDTGWKNAGAADDYLLVMGWWMLHVHQVLERVRNTAYAFEGIIPSYLAANARGDQIAVEDLGWAIDQGLARLTSWQVGGPLQDRNPFLLAHPTSDPLAVGGILNSAAEGPLRIDVTQHQLHAVMLALQHVYGD